MSFNIQEWVDTHPELAGLSKERFVQRARLRLGLPKEAVLRYWQSSKFKQVRLLFKRTRARAHRREGDKLEPSIVAPPGAYQIDVITFETDSAPESTRRALVMIEIYTRRAYVVPLNGNDMVHDILPAYQRILDQIKQQYAKVDQQREDLADELAYSKKQRIWSAQWAPAYPPAPAAGIVSVSGDNEFNSKPFVDYNAAHGVTVATFTAKHVHNAERQGGNALGMVDSFVRTIKHMIRTYALSHDNPHWGSYLQDVVELYNDTAHSGLKMLTPNWVFAHPEALWDDMVDKARLNKRIEAMLESGEHYTEDQVHKVMGHKRHLKLKLAGRLEIGDLVLALKDKPSKLTKGPRQNVDQIFVVHTVLPKQRYQLVAYKELIDRGWTVAGNLEWGEQLRPESRIYTRAELYKLSDEDLTGLHGADLDLPVEAYERAMKQRARKDVQYSPHEPVEVQPRAPAQVPGTVDFAQYPERYRAALQRYYDEFTKEPGEDLLAELKSLREDHLPKPTQYALADLLKRHRPTFLRMFALTARLVELKLVSARVFAGWVKAINQTKPYT